MSRNAKAVEIATIPAYVIGFLVGLAGTIYATVAEVQAHAWAMLFFAVPELLGMLEGALAALTVFLVAWLPVRAVLQLRPA